MEKVLELIHYARNYSDFYRDMYRGIPWNEKTLSCYPVVNQEQFWKANEDFGKGVLTRKHNSGIVFKSGGTTGKPKYSYFTAREWDDFTRVSGEGFKQNGIRPGDRIANLFYAGELYASFIYVSDLIKSAGIGINYPISGQCPVPEAIHMIRKLGINVLAGVPTTLMRIIDYLGQHDIDKPDIDLILFGGESFYPDQLAAVKTVLPDARVNSILYASVDAGELGYFDALSCENGEHRCYDQSTILEIIDEQSGEPVIDEDKPGKLLVTNLNRRLMPLIRYPVGDRAVWCEPAGTPDRKFRLLGRSEEGARIGPATLYVQDVLDVLDHFTNKVQVLNFQIVISHKEQKDHALIKAVPLHLPKNSDVMASEVIEYLYLQRPMLQDLLDSGVIFPLELQWCRAEELESNLRTGKTRKILDKRL